MRYLLLLLLLAGCAHEPKVLKSDGAKVVPPIGFIVYCAEHKNEPVECGGTK